MYTSYLNEETEKERSMRIHFMPYFLFYTSGVYNKLGDILGIIVAETTI